MKKFIAFFILLMPLATFAHEGHDHSHWSAGIIHLGLFVSFIAVAIFGYKLIKHSKIGNKTDKH